VPNQPGRTNTIRIILYISATEPDLKPMESNVEFPLDMESGLVTYPASLRTLIQIMLAAYGFRSVASCQRRWALVSHLGNTELATGGGTSERVGV